MTPNSWVTKFLTFNDPCESHFTDHVNLTSTAPAGLTPSIPVNYTWPQYFLLLMVTWFSPLLTPFPPPTRC